MSAAIWITPSDDNKFLPVETFGLEPHAPVRLIAAIGALRHDALNSMAAGQPVEFWAVANLVIVGGSVRINRHPIHRAGDCLWRLGSTGLMRLMAAKILKGARPICDKRAANSG